MPYHRGTSVPLFNGVNQYAQGPDDVVPATGDYTVSVWAKQQTNQAGQYSHIFAQGRDLYLGPDINGIIRLGDSWINTGVAFHPIYNGITMLLSALAPTLSFILMVPWLLPRVVQSLPRCEWYLAA